MRLLEGSRGLNRLERFKSAASKKEIPHKKGKSYLEKVKSSKSRAKASGNVAQQKAEAGKRVSKRVGKQPNVRKEGPPLKDLSSKESARYQGAYRRAYNEEVEMRELKMSDLLSEGSMGEKKAFRKFNSKDDAVHKEGLKKVNKFDAKKKLRQLKKSGLAK